MAAFDTLWIEAAASTSGSGSGGLAEVGRGAEISTVETGRRTCCALAGSVFGFERACRRPSSARSAQPRHVPLPGCRIFDRLEVGTLESPLLATSS